MSEIEQKLSRLIEALITKTENGIVHWDVTVSPNKFVSHFTDPGVEIARIPPTQYDAEGFKMSLINPNGDEIESKTSYVGFPPSVSDYQNMETLFNSARRSSYNVEESLDSLLQELEGV